MFKINLDSSIIISHLSGGMKIFSKEFEERLEKTITHKKIGKPVSNRRLIRLELYKLEKCIMGEGEYKPFIWEW